MFSSKCGFIVNVYFISIAHTEGMAQAKFN